MRHASLVGAALLVVGCGGAEPPAPSAPAPTLAERLAALGGAPCAGARAFTCAKLPVPLDHGDPSGPKLSIAIAVRPASGTAPSLGPLYTVDGGPGYSGIADVDDLVWLDPRLRERFDLVYFDLRGVGGSGVVQCDAATAAYYADGLRVASQADGDALAIKARAYAAACGPATGWSNHDLSLLTTAQAAEDIESIRVALGAPAITLYGLSYGTQLSQQYVAAHPDTTRAVALDGVIDLTRVDVDYASDLSRAVNTVLGDVLAGCGGDAACAADLPDASAAYDAVAAVLESAPANVASPMPSGEIRARTFTRKDLDSVTALATDDQGGRTALLRALAAADLRSDFVPLRRLLDAFGQIDPETDGYLGEDFSDAIYYTFTCNDYGRPKGGADAWIARGEADRVQFGLRSTSDFYGDLPCVSWPSAPPELGRPPPFAPPGVPAILVNAEADVDTPVDNGDAVLAAMRAAGGDARGVHIAGGHHVMWGYGTCADPALNDFLIDPADSSLARDISCDAHLLTAYPPLGPVDGAALTTALDVGAALAAELAALPAFPYAGKQGCDLGGRVDIPDDLVIAMHGCTFFEGLVVDGTGGTNDAATRINLRISLQGAHTGSLHYDQDPKGATVTGTFDGAPVDAHSSAPFPRPRAMPHRRNHRRWRRALSGGRDKWEN